MNVKPERSHFRLGTAVPAPHAVASKCGLIGEMKRRADRKVALAYAEADS